MAPSIVPVRSIAEDWDSFRMGSVTQHSMDVELIDH